MEAPYSEEFHVVGASAEALADFKARVAKNVEAHEDTIDMTAYSVDHGAIATTLRQLGVQCRYNDGSLKVRARDVIGGTVGHWMLADRPTLDVVRQAIAKSYKTRVGGGVRTDAAFKPIRLSRRRLHRLCIDIAYAYNEYGEQDHGRHTCSPKRRRLRRRHGLRWWLTWLFGGLGTTVVVALLGFFG